MRLLYQVLPAPWQGGPAETPDQTRERLASYLIKQLPPGAVEEMTEALMGCSEIMWLSGGRRVRVVTDEQWATMPLASEG